VFDFILCTEYLPFFPCGSRPVALSSPLIDYERADRFGLRFLSPFLANPFPCPRFVPAPTSFSNAKRREHIRRIQPKGALFKLILHLFFSFLPFLCLFCRLQVLFLSPEDLFILFGSASFHSDRETNAITSCPHPPPLLFST